MVYTGVAGGGGEALPTAGRAMIIDFHCHILPPDFVDRHYELAARDATYAALFPRAGGRMADAEALRRDMAAAGVDRAVAMGFGWTDPAVAAAAIRGGTAMPAMRHNRATQAAVQTQRDTPDWK